MKKLINFIILTNIIFFTSFIQAKNNDNQLMGKYNTNICENYSLMQDNSKEFLNKTKIHLKVQKEHLCYKYSYVNIS